MGWCEMAGLGRSSLSQRVGLGPENVRKTDSLGASFTLFYLQRFSSFPPHWHPLKRMEHLFSRGTTVGSDVNEKAY